MPELTTLSFRASEETKAFVEQEATELGFSSVDEYMNALLSAERRRKAEQRLEALLLQGLDGDAAVVDDAWWDRWRRDLLDRHPSAHL